MASSVSTFKLGAIAEAKQCSSPILHDGQWVCAVKLSAGGAKVDLAVYATEGEAKAMRDHIAAHGDASGGPAPIKTSINCGQTKVAGMVKDSSQLHAAPTATYVGKKAKGIMLP